MDEGLYQDYLEEQFPAVSKALVDRLDVIFPNSCPEMTDPDRLVWLKTGQHSVVTLLRARYDEQQKHGKE